jgi:hypothetical protein
MSINDAVYKQLIVCKDISVNLKKELDDLGLLIWKMEKMLNRGVD